MNKPIIGACEFLTLPDLGISLKVRVDTGARTSALHATDIESFRREGERWVRFVAHQGDTDHSPPVPCEARVIDYRKVRNTSGIPVPRYVIRTTLRLAEWHWECEITLTSRDRMRYPMLLGRLALRDRFLVDPSHAFLHGRPRRKKRFKAKRPK